MFKAQLISIAWLKRKKSRFPKVRLILAEIVLQDPKMIQND